MENISLIWPTGQKKERNPKLPVDFIKDLDLERIALDIYFENHKFALRVLSELCEDPDTIKYRQDILEDFLGV